MIDPQDASVFPSAQNVRSLFSTFGNILRIQAVDGTADAISVVIEFEHALSASLVVQSNGMLLGDRKLSARLIDTTRRVESEMPVRAPMRPSRHDPSSSSMLHNIGSLRWRPQSVHPDHLSLFAGFANSPQAQRQISQLNAEVQPFVPTGAPSSWSPAGPMPPFFTMPRIPRQQGLTVSLTHSREGTGSDDAPIASRPSTKLSNRVENIGSEVESEAPGLGSGSGTASSNGQPSSPPKPSSSQGDDPLLVSTGSGSSDGVIKRDASSLQLEGNLVKEEDTLANNRGHVSTDVGAIGDRWKNGGTAGWLKGGMWC